MVVPKGGYTPEYQSWMAMRLRCNNPARPNYRYYGGRGIKVCPQWDSFQQFLADMGPRPAGTTLDRIDHNGHYEPSNCRWADLFTQNSNRDRPVRTRPQGRLTPAAVREIRKLHAEGATQAALAERFDVSTSAIYLVVVGKTWRHVA